MQINGKDYCVDESRVSPTQVMACIAYINAHLRPFPKTSWAPGTTYGLKHVIERHTGFYISNDSLIVACARLGMRMRPTLGRGYPENYQLGISKNAFK